MRQAALGAENVRAGIEDFPEVSEVKAIRYFTRLSRWNYAIDPRHVSARFLHHEVQPARERNWCLARKDWHGRTRTSRRRWPRVPWKPWRGWKEN